MRCCVQSCKFNQPCGGCRGLLGPHLRSESGCKYTTSKWHKIGGFEHTFFGTKGTSACDEHFEIADECARCAQWLSGKDSKLRYDAFIQLAKRARFSAANRQVCPKYIQIRALFACKKTDTKI